MTLKEELYNFCQGSIQERLLVCKERIAKIQESLLSETKSSAGDKHETGRAMLQLEREKLGQQLAVIENENAQLLKVDYKTQSNIVKLGSLVYTTQHNYFISISAGEIVVDNTKFYAISPNTPIGKLVIGKQSSEEVVFRALRFTITTVT